MSPRYCSVFASDLKDFVALKRAAGYRYESAEYSLWRFDRYACKHAEDGCFSRELILVWAQATNEKPASHKVRISPVREFGKYLQSIGISEAFVLPTGLHRKTARYVPHFFTKDEIFSFFHACDSLKPHGSFPIRHWVLPVLFRLLYCCGLRTCEARTLRVEDVDLHLGQIDIVASKQERSRRIPIGRDLLELLQTYNTQISTVYQDRIFFFPTTPSRCYAQSSLGIAFRKIWNTAVPGGGYGNKARAYDFRHHFALTNLNRWVVAGADLNSMLPYLSTYMGHACLQSTDYYLHLVPEFFHTFREKLRSTENLIPEFRHDQ